MAQSDGQACGVRTQVDDGLDSVNTGIHFYAEKMMLQISAWTGECR